MWIRLQKMFIRLIQQLCFVWSKETHWQLTLKNDIKVTLHPSETTRKETRLSLRISVPSPRGGNVFSTVGGYGYT